MSAHRDIALEAKSWPFQEAAKLLDRIGGQTPTKGYALFETGYGPSGLPHIGTFAEVARTGMIRRAFAELSDVPTRLFAFSDDLDGLRKVPDNVPNQEMLAQHLGKPLTQVPDPFGTHDSFGQHNNARLQAFLDDFGFEYEFISSTECYTEGRFDEALVTMLRHYDEVMAVILPTLGPERRATYSPFLPVCPKTGIVLQVPMLETRPDDATVVYQDEDGGKVETLVTGGHCKLQWKADWAMRWFALDVDYEMSGKDLIDSVRLSSRICKILGGRPPEGLTYELFLDEDGKKISKSLGNGLAIEDWLRYAAPESLSTYMFQSPRKAKRLFFDVIPRARDDYLTHLGNYHGQDGAKALDNPVWHVHGGTPPDEDVPLSFGLLMNLASACNSEDKAVLWGFISRYAPGASSEQNPILDRLIGYAIAYYQGFVKPNKIYRAPDATERAAMEDLLECLSDMAEGASGEEIQTEVYEIGKRHGFENLRDWFRALYEVLFGQSQGPRFGSFAALYGVGETADLIRQGLDGAFMND
jgi:lysyl-tRNA synthetase class 1